VQRPFNRIQYRGRFAPSPTGPLHFGSLVAAVGSYLDARHHQGKWLVRIEDLDTPRTVSGAADDILSTLEAYGLHWDEDIIYQSQRTAAYEEAFHSLKEAGVVYPCACSRKEIADSALHGIDGMIYPGTCRDGARPLPNPDETTSHSTRPASGQVAGYPPEGEGTTVARTMAWRVRTNIFTSPLAEARTKLPSPSGGRAGEGGVTVKFDDALQGSIALHLENEIGDFVVLRADGLFAYQLAVVVDDAAQGITDVVRGADLLYSTPRQIYLQRLLGLPTPAYMHLPVVVNAQGEKLSKQTLAQPVERHDAVTTIYAALTFLLQHPPAEFQRSDLATLWNWAIANWQPDAMLGMLSAPQPN
jgi:glutamyl-Q tRNA(Asp) synthetase